MIQVAGVLVIQNGEYVLQHRDDKPGIAEPGKYSLWGGRVELGETPLKAVKRELREETNIVVHEDDFLPLCDYLTTGKGPAEIGQPVHIHIYAVKVGDHARINQSEGQGIVRLKLHEPLPDKITEYTRKAVETYETQA